MLPACMNNHEWQPDHPKLYGTLTDPDPYEDEQGLAEHKVYYPLLTGSKRAEKPLRRFYLTQKPAHVLNEGPYARSPAYAARIVFSSSPNPTQIGPTAMEIYEGSLPYRLETDEFTDGNMEPVNEGLTSIRSCMQFLYFSGIIDIYTSTHKFNDMLEWLIWGMGPLLIDLPVYKDFTFDEGQTMELAGEIIGRETYIWNGVRYQSDEARLMSVHGYDWGVKGMKRMTLGDLQSLVEDNGLRAWGMIGKHVGVQAARIRDERKTEANHRLTLYDNTMKLRKIAEQLVEAGL